MSVFRSQGLGAVSLTRSSIDSLAAAPGWPNAVVLVQARSVAGDGGGGVFSWVPGDQSDDVAADPEQGVWVAPNGANGSAGAWKRQYEGRLNLRWWGASPDSTLAEPETDNQTAIDAAIAYADYLGGATIYAPGGDAGYGYAHSATMLFENQGTVIEGDGGEGHRDDRSVSTTTTYVGRGQIVGGTAFIATFSDVGGTTLGASPLTTTNGSPVVTVAHTAHGKTTGEIATFSGAAAVGGITLSGNYKITVVDANSYTVTHASNASSGATGGGSAVVVQFGKPQVWVANDSCGVRGVSLARSDAAYGAVSTPPLWSPLDCGFLAYPKDDTGYQTARRWICTGVRILNQPGTGQILADNCVSGEAAGVEINFVRGHGVQVAGGSYLNRTNTRTNPGQFDLRHYVVCDVGGQTINTTGYEVDNYDSAYRVDLHNFEGFYEYITPSVVPSVVQGFGAALGGTSMNGYNCGFSGRDPDGVAHHGALILRGANITMYEPRYIDPTSPGVDIIAPWTGGGSNSTNINAGDRIYAISTTHGDAYFNPLIRVASTTRGVSASMDDPSADVATLMTKTAGTRYWERFNGAISTDMSVTGSAVTATGALTGSTSSVSRATAPQRRGISEFTIPDDRAAYIEFSASARGLFAINGNISGAKGGEFRFRASGDANSFAEAIGASSGAVATTGALAGTTGTDGNLTISVANSGSVLRLYIENRTGASAAYAMGIDLAGTDVTLTGPTLI